MSDVAIEVKGLSKQYSIGVRESYSTLRDTLAQYASSLFRRNGSKQAEGILWAVKDLDFTVRQGEVLGVIGRNGAGKSTLLKLLSRITAPTSGYADIYGRVRSLLEVGTGFHPELTGRENIYLNGAILGMKRTDIMRRFDEIVAFAEVEKFIETPVKRFSSGMYLRLAFAVAAHLTSEILLVDEVLAVGDAAFQKKCLGKMGEVAHEGRTVLFVSHNMAAVRALCTRGLLMEQGKVFKTGAIENVLYEYTQSQNRKPVATPGQACFSAVRINDRNPGTIGSGDSFRAACTLDVPGPLPGFRLFCIIQDANGDPIVVAPTNHRELPMDAGSHEISASFPGLWLRPGVYSVHFKLLINTADAGQGRIFSDSILLDISGSSDPELLLGYIAPEVAWRLESPAAVGR